MKKLILLACCAMIAAGLSAQDTKKDPPKGVIAPTGSQSLTPTPPTPPTSPAPNTSPTAPEIVFETDAHDFGTLQKGAPCEFEFKFKNTGKEPLIIQNAQASCGCTVPSYPKEPIMPGQGGVIKVKYDSNRIGAFTKTVNVTSNAKNSPKIITIKGKIDAPPQEEQFPGNNNNTGIKN
ncbi:MAG: DUF1573 domain-containing protein [Bacteroidia bacterium]|nr:DUF1573 domain-containing protein [Bacteroidia bacterium]